MALTASQKAHLLHHFIAGSRASTVAQLMGLHEATVYRHFTAFAFAFDRGPFETFDRPPPAYIGPDWIGHAIGDPPTPEGEGWIGTRLNPPTHSG